MVRAEKLIGNSEQKWINTKYKHQMVWTPWWHFFTNYNANSFDIILNIQYDFLNVIVDGLWSLEIWEYVFSWYLQNKIKK